MLFSVIRDEIITEVGGSTSDSGLQTLIFGFMKSALRRFPRHTRSRILIDIAYATLSQGEQTLPVPSDFVRERQVYYLDSNNKRVEIDKLSFDEFNEQYNAGSGSQSKPKGYRIYGSTIEFIHQADGTYTVYLEYYKSVDDIETTDDFFASSDVIEIAKDGAKYYYFDYEENYPKAAEKLGLFKAGLDKLEVDFLSDELPEYVQEH